MSTADRKARQKEGLRQEILDAARDLFVREGYDNVSIRKIADRVEYSPGTIYLHFQDKAEILDTLCAETFARLDKRMEAIEKDKGCPLEGLRRGMRTYIQFGLDHPSHYIVTFIVTAQHHKGPACPKANVGQTSFDHLRHIVRRCLDAGLLREGDAEEFAQALWAPMHGVTALLLMCPGFPFIEHTRLIERVIEIAIEGVRKR